MAELPEQYRDKLLEASRKKLDDLQEIGGQLTDEAWHTPLPDEKLTPHQALARLAAVQAELVSPILATLMAGHAADPLPYFEEQVWLEQRYQNDQDWLGLYQQFAEPFTQAVADLAQLSPEAWSAVGRHPYYGRRTLQWWFERAVMGMEIVQQMIAAAVHK